MMSRVVWPGSTRFHYRKQVNEHNKPEFNNVLLDKFAYFLYIEQKVHACLTRLLFNVYSV